jgi:gamma-glutamyltranspeptidase/glutathione hydrolase
MVNPHYDRLRVDRTIGRKVPAVSDFGAVSAHHYAGAEAGAAVLEAGGNAVDAAVTAAFAMQVVEPWMTSLSACGYMLIAEPDGRVTVVEFTGRVPAVYDPDLYRPDPTLKTFIGHPMTVGETNARGFTATVVPGCVAGFATALDRFGTIGLDRALRPAIDLARAGQTVDWHATLAIAMAEAELAANPGCRARFLPNGHPPEPGTVLPTGALAATLERLAADGPAALYGGPTGEALVADLAAGGSPIRLDDLAAYAPLVYPARSMPFGGKTVHVAGATSGGERLTDALAHFEARRGAGPVDACFFVAQAEALWHAFDAHRRRLAPAETNPKSSTTHINAVDHDGRMVAITFTLLNRFGARALSPATGILLNNGMSWFDPRPDRAASLTPEAYAPSNMCPVAITDADGPFAVLGAAGGNQIVPTMSQLTAMLVMAGLDPEEAMNRPRMSTGPTRDITVNVDMAPDELAALAAIAPLKPAQQTVFPRPFAAPDITGRRGNAFVAMPDTTYPAAYAAAAERR